MTEAEREVIDALVKAWNAFVQLPVEHPEHQAAGDVNV